jgi:hypothetical protein
MDNQALIGAVLLIIAVGLIFIGLPDKDYRSPRFLRFGPATVVYPPIVLIFLVGGLAELIFGVFNITN